MKKNLLILKSISIATGFGKSTIKKIILFLLAGVTISAFFLSCQEDEIPLNSETEAEHLQLKSATYTAGDIDALVLKIENFLSNGEIESGLANSFIVKLQNSKKSLEKDNEKASANQLQALMNQIKDLLSEGTVKAAIGQEIIFDLKLLAGENPTFIDPRDNRVYKTIKIGDQVWMAENLAYLPKVYYPVLRSYNEPRYYVYGYFGTLGTDGYLHPIVEGAKATANYETYGVLYNWPAALSACPEGWHLPDNAEWEQLAAYLIDNGYGYGGDGDDIAKALAATSGWYWDEWSCGEGTPANNMLSNNSSGFSGLPGGLNMTTSTRNFDGMEMFGVWWSATGENSIAYFWGLYYRYTQLTKYCNQDLYMGYSVRCVRN